MSEVDEQKQSLINQQTTGQALKELQNHQGWKELVTILSAVYKESVENLIKADSAEDRAMIKAIENLSVQIALKVQYAEVAAEELKSEKFKTMPATSE